MTVLLPTDGDSGPRLKIGSQGRRIGMDGWRGAPYFQVSVAAHWQQSPSYWRDMIAPAPNDRAHADEIIAAVLMPA